MEHTPTRHWPTRSQRIVPALDAVPPEDRSNATHYLLGTLASMVALDELTEALARTVERYRRDVEPSPVADDDPFGWPTQTPQLVDGAF